ncbi:hypothetical protein AB434_0140 [Heyndrickxia coagulans]|uniref:Uncharacterized protein n=1 Tax=Heyndrickxia coagulans TaxID=1398 RepID=A0A0C5CK91_HEYCO|nr:hypothetical protein SB48_HM08orf01594 [Heyndrickxia coagulans]AKN52545.1 hypothetical protein AB434_0140 [Heyndrickxia coagulans]KWZ81563.1 hypothetical protein HMPREF3213_01978 [Heyndrickxia coagulans]
MKHSISPFAYHTKFVLPRKKSCFIIVLMQRKNFTGNWRNSVFLNKHPVL